MRTTRPQMFMEIAHAVAKRSTCMRLNVGAVIVQDRSIVSIGYNGAPTGEPHCTQETCNAQTSCQRTIHAEDNALRHLPGDIEWRDNVNALDMYVTDSPCAHCFDKIGQTGLFGRIFFGTPYRINDHLIDSLWDIEIYRVLPSGYVIDWNTKELVDIET